ncbi:uncharacterized protein [Haliotis cracherodii]|uniref:uncharacterized protein n=1 Tax=Haliotis cracherodii TaxID=6455 RepID=UPI0039E9B40F
MSSSSESSVGDGDDDSNGTNGTFDEESVFVSNEFNPETDVLSTSCTEDEGKQNTMSIQDTEGLFCITEASTNTGPNTEDPIVLLSEDESENECVSGPLSDLIKSRPRGQKKSLELVELTQEGTQLLATATTELYNRKKALAATNRHPTSIVINNPRLYLSKKTELNAPKARNVAVGGQQVVHQPQGPRSEDHTQKTKTPRDPRVHRIRERTKKEIKRWTEARFKMSFVDDIVKKIESGQHWITITGNAGDGKTTTAYMVLDEMTKQGREVFHVKEPDQYYILTENTNQRVKFVVMLNDVIGAFALDKLAFSKWKPVIFDALENIRKTNKSEFASTLTIIFVHRANVLNEAHGSFDKHTPDIVGKEALTSLASLPETERMEILQYHLTLAGIVDIPESRKQQVVRTKTPHGFPHCCQMFTELKAKGKQVDIEKFFSCPLECLDNVTKTYLDNEETKEVFKMLMKKDGKLDLNEIDDDEERNHIQSVSSPLFGSYLSDNNGMITFSHSSIYESVAHCIGQLDVVFAIKHFSFSYIMQSMKFIETQCISRNVISVAPSRINITTLCKRFTQPVAYRWFSVLEHNFFQKEDFCRIFFSSLIRTNNLNIENDKLVALNNEDNNGDTMLHVVSRCKKTTAIQVLLEYGADVNKGNRRGKTAFHSLCEGEGVDASALKLMLKHGADVNKVSGDGGTALHCLCTASTVDVATVELMIKNNIDLNWADGMGYTALHYLCARKDVDTSVFDLMIKHGADVNIVGVDGKSALHVLCGEGDVNSSNVALLIQHGAYVNKAGVEGCTALHRLCARDDVNESAIKLLLQNGAHVNKADVEGRTALHCLCERDDVNESALKLLLLKGADINKESVVGFTALHCLCGGDDVNESAIKLLLQNGADVNKADMEGVTALHCLCGGDDVNESTIKLLLQNGADVNKAGVKGVTALHYLCARDDVNENAIKLLLENGADVNKADGKGRTALHCLCARDDVNKSAVKQLLQNGADVNKAEEEGVTALLYLCGGDDVNESAIKLLLQNGADVNKAEEEGVTALHYLCARDDVNESAIKLLLQNGADVNKESVEGVTALHYLCVGDDVNESAIKLLLQHGADVNKAGVEGRTALHYLSEGDDSTAQGLIHRDPVNMTGDDESRRHQRCICICC